MAERILGLAALLAFAISGGCASKKSAAVSPVLANTSINQFLTRRPLTFVLGTSGNAAADHRIATQVGLLRGLALPKSSVVLDGSIDVTKGAAGWPANPVLYGSTHENSILSALAPTLPFSVSADRIEIGGKVYQGDGHRLVVVVPARGPDALGPGYPEFLLYAGTGLGGIAEINAGLPGGAPILIADGFGGLVAGTWKAGAGAQAEGDVSLAPGRRIAYRRVERKIESVSGTTSSVVTFKFPEMVDEHPDETAVIDACMRGLQTVVAKLDIEDPVALSVYVYPDERSKQELTGQGGHGHAVPSARALHVLQVGGEHIAAMESLLAHEGTHVLGYYAWGPSGTALMGEGLAVWVSGTYQGRPLADWKDALDRVPSVETMVGVGWGKLAEPGKYPPAGILVDEAMKAVGPAKVREHLVGATFETWPRACEEAGTTSDALQTALVQSTSAATR